MGANQTVELKEEKELKDTKIYINCSVCKREKQSSTILHAVNQTGEISDDDENYFQWGERSQLVICNGCESIFLRRRSWNSEEVDYGYDRAGNTTAECIVTETLYPTIQKSRELEKHFHLIPDDLLDIYEETSKS